MLKKFAAYYKPHLGLFIADMACAMVLALCNLFYPMITRNIINKYVPARDLKMMLIWAAVLLGIYFLKMGLNYFILYWGHIMGVHMQVDMRRDAFDHLLVLPLSYYDKTKTGTIMSRIVNDTMDITELAHHGPEDLFISCVTLIGSFVLLLQMNVELTLIIYAFVPLLVIFAARKRVKLRDTSMRTRKEIGEINAGLENSIAGVRVSRAFGASSHERENFKSTIKSYESATGKHYEAMAEFHTGTTLILDVLVLVTMVSGGLFTYYGRINAGDYAAYLLFTGLFTDPIKRLISFVDQYQSGMTGFNRLQELMAVEPEKDDEGARTLKEVRGDIRFEDVGFTYDDGKAVLQNLNLEIAPGKALALVGPSGGGKSTLCHLIPRFYELDSGRITLDGVDIRDYTRLSLRRKIGIVQQDTFLFTGTIRDNIAYGDFGADDERIIDAAKKAHIHDFIEQLPNGYDTFVGERGVMLSGGQKQRIAIARIFLKNPPILILDEATSALDNVTEQLIQASLDELSRGRTTLVVAHRLSTIRNAETIVVMTEDGIAESGTHAELLEQDGIYARLWHAQTQTVSALNK